MTQAPDPGSGRAAGRSRRTMQGERRTVTVLFCDVAGSTAMAEQLDPEEWAEIMNDAFGYLTGPVERYGGTVARLMGDAILAFFGAPTAHEDDPQRAILAGLDILDGVAPFREEIKNEYGLDFNVRIGINTGPVVVGEVGSDFAGEYTAMGDAVNVAARMEQTAQPGSVQVADNTHALTAPLFDFETLPSIEVKGKAEPVATFRVLGSKAEPGRLRGIEGLSAPLVGRDEEFATLSNVLSELREGRGQIVFMVGEPGLGKSRLIDELRRNWGDAPWIESRGISFDTARPYGQLQQQVRQLFGVREDDTPAALREKLSSSPQGFPEDLHVSWGRVMDILMAINPEAGGPQLEGEALKRDLFEEVTGTWRHVAESRPAVVVFDDLHWADPASAELLQHLLELTEEVPILFLCASRPERQSAGWRVRQTAETDFPHRYTEVALSPLSGDDSDVLVSSLLTVSDLPETLRRTIMEKTDGNPFFVEEVVRTLIDSGAVVRDESGEHWRAASNIGEISIPENVQSLITARFDSLDEEVRSTLQMASVIGRAFYYRVLEMVTEETSTLRRQLSTLQRVELIQEAARMPELEYMFRHELTREAAYSSILRRRCRQFHRRVGEAIEEMFADRVEEQASRLAHHFDEGREFDKAILYYTQAADAAARIYANEEAETLYGKALALSAQTPIDRDRLVHLYTACGKILQLLGRYDEAIARFEGLEALGRKRGDRAMELAALMSQATVFSTYTSRFDPARGEVLSKRSLELAKELKDPEAEAKALWNLMLVMTFGEADYALAAEYGEQSIAIARRHDLKEQLAFTLNDISRDYIWAGQRDKAWSVLGESRALWREMGNMPMLGDNLQASADAHFMAGEYAESVKLGEEALAVSRSSRNMWGEAASMMAAAPGLLELGELAKCTRYAVNALALAEQVGFGAVIFLRPMLGWMYHETGEFEKGFEIVQHGLDLVGDSELQGDQAMIRPILHSVRAALGTASGDLSRVEADLEVAEQLVENTNEGVMDYGGMSIIFETLIIGNARLASGEFDRVLSATDRALDRMHSKRIVCLISDVHRQRGQALHGLGRVDEANAALAESKAVAEQQGSMRALWQALSALAQAESARGNRAEAGTLYGEARRIVDGIADGIDTPEQQAAFRASPRVRTVLESGG